MSPSSLLRALLACAAAALAIPASGFAQSLADPVDQWLPSSDRAAWRYQWDSAFAPNPAAETYTLERREGAAFLLKWTTSAIGDADFLPSEGEMEYRRTDLGLVNTNWASTPPPPQYPILCAGADRCANSLAGVHYMLIWGNRSPVLLEPLVKGARWNSLGGVGNDVSSSSRYVGRSTIKVPAFPRPVLTAKVQTEIRGRRAGRSVRQRDADRVLAARGGAGANRVSPWRRAGQPCRSRRDEPRAAPAAAFRRELPAAEPRRQVASCAGATPSTCAAGRRRTSRWAEVVNNTARVDVKEVSRPIRVRRRVRVLDAADGDSQPLGPDARDITLRSSRRWGRCLPRATSAGGCSRRSISWCSG